MIGNLNDLLALIKEMLEGLGVESWISQIIVGILASIFIGTIIGKTIRDIFNYFVNKHRKKLTAKDLHPFYSPREIDDATRYYIKTQFQNVPPSEDDEPGRSYIAAARRPLIPLFLNKAFKSGKDDTKYYLVLADSGMGKTTFMINLYLAYKFKKVWFWQKPKHKIKLLPLGNPMSIERIKEMSKEEKEDTILLLDAFDEDNKAVENYQERLGEILKVVWEFREVVITCRTQFFPSDKDVPLETGYFRYGTDSGQFNFQRIYISVFSDNDIQKYINKKFNSFKDYFSSKRAKALAITLKAPNLMMRPMLLSNIDDIIASGRTIQHGYEIYEILIDSWLEREANKPGIIQKYGNSYKELLLNFSKALARDLYLNREKRRNKLSLLSNEIIDNKDGLQLKDLEDNLIHIHQQDQGSRTLLNRNALGEYKFSHKSILEYFLANELIANYEFRKKISFTNDLDAAKIFLFDILYFKNIDFKWWTKDGEKIIRNESIKKDELDKTRPIFTNLFVIRDLKLVDEFSKFSKSKFYGENNQYFTFFSALVKLSAPNFISIIGVLIAISLYFFVNEVTGKEKIIVTQFFITITTILLVATLYNLFKGVFYLRQNLNTDDLGKMKKNDKVM